MIKAPTGGMASPVNGQFYNGGEFMPITGEYCGKGANRITPVKLAEINAKSLTNCRIQWNDNRGHFEVIQSVKLNDGTTIEQKVTSGQNAEKLSKLFC